jgi:hypothetical protein
MKPGFYWARFDRSNSQSEPWRPVEIVQRAFGDELDIFVIGREDSRPIEEGWQFKGELIPPKD